MTQLDVFVAGIDPGHLPALFAAVLLALLWVPVSLAVRGARRGPAGRYPLSLPAWVAGWLLAESAVIHLALPLGHHHGGPIVLAFLGSGLAYAWLAWRVLARAAFDRRWWRYATAVLVVLTLIGYLAVVGSGDEGPDQVGFATAVLELVALGLCLVPADTPDRPNRLARGGGGTAFVAVVVLFGVAAWALALAPRPAGTADHTHGTAADHTHGTAADQDHGAPVDHDHSSPAGHSHATRAQAGVIMEPDSGRQPTAAETLAAGDFAARTRAALVRFADIHAALAEGYRATGVRRGYGVHLEQKSYGDDGRILDPDHPEQLMYAIADGRATLLSAVYIMPRAGMRGPTPGGPLTRWHSHNLCLTLLPPGFGGVSPYGTCPAFSITTTLPEMMHVWVVDNPGGPYADNVPGAWTAAHNRAYGVVFSW